MPEAQRRTGPSAPTPAPALLARHFLADELPEALRPTRESHRLQVAVIWGGNQLIEVKDVLPGEPFTLGMKGSSVEVYQGLHSSGPLPFVREEKDGTQRLFLPESASPTVHRAGERVEFETLIRSGQAERLDLPVKGVQYRLDLNERATMQFGDLQVVARYTRPEWFKRRTAMERMDLNFASGLVILAMVAVVGVKMMQMMPPHQMNEEDRLQKIREITSVFEVAPAPTVPPKNAGAQAPRLDEGQIGRRNNQPHRPAAPPRTDPDQRRAQNVALVNQTGILALLNAPGAADRVMGSANSVEGLERTLGNVRGAPALADNGGLEGFGSRGNGPGGGGHGMTIGGLNRTPEDGVGGGTRGGIEIPGIKKVIVPISRPQVAGIDSGYRDQIARVIRNHWNEIKYCYEKELQKDPNLDGKIAVGFDIGPNGLVTQSEIREASLESPAVQQCVLSRVRNWQFPPPPITVVTVNYPFIFSAAR